MVGASTRTGLRGARTPIYLVVSIGLIKLVLRISHATAAPMVG
jgi:hypothetical protein